MIGVLLAVLLAIPQATEREVEWFDHYERALRSIERGDAAVARQELGKALALRSAEGLQVPVRFGQYIDYLPHLYLAVAAQMQGEVKQARLHLREAEKSGFAQKSDMGRPLLFAYQQLLRGTC